MALCETAYAEVESGDCAEVDAIAYEIYETTAGAGDCEGGGDDSHRVNFFELHSSEILMDAATRKTLMSSASGEWVT